MVNTVQMAQVDVRPHRRPICGFTYERGPVCLTCAESSELMTAHRMGRRERAIVSPSPRGEYKPVKESENYDAACVVCGWAIRQPKDAYDW